MISTGGFCKGCLHHLSIQLLTDHNQTRSRQIVENAHYNGRSLRTDPCDTPSCLIELQCK